MGLRVQTHAPPNAWCRQRVLLPHQRLQPSAAWKQQRQRLQICSPYPKFAAQAAEALLVHAPMGEWEPTGFMLAVNRIARYMGLSPL